MDHLSSVRVFVRVVELSGFSRAAENLGLPKSAVSTAIAALEDRLGTQLLFRTTRRVLPTHDGQVFYERALTLLAQADDLDSLFRSEGDITGTIRVDMPVGMARNLIVERLPEFLDLHPGIHLELSATDRFVDVVAEGFDCVVRVGPSHDSALIIRKLGELNAINVASPAYVARYGLPQTLDDLKDHRLVHYATQLGQVPWGFEYYHNGAYHELKMAGSVTVNNSVAYKAAALAGLGIIQGPCISLKTHLDSGALIEVLPQYVAAPMPVSLLYPRRRHQARRVRLFIDWLADIMKTYTQVCAPHKRLDKGAVLGGS